MHAKDIPNMIVLSESCNPYLRGWLLNATWRDEALAEYMYVLSCLCKLVTAALVVLI